MCVYIYIYIILKQTAHYTQIPLHLEATVNSFEIRICVYYFVLFLVCHYVTNTSVLQNTDNFLTSLTAVSFLRKAPASVRLLFAVTRDLTVAALETTDYVMERFAFVVVRYKILAVVTMMILAMCETNCR